jgi:histidine triad (HIT) family protein
MTEECLFCRIARGDFNTEFLYENDGVVAFRDLNPQASTHVLVIPRQHIATINDLDAGNSAVVGRIYEAAREVAAIEGLAERGYRVVMNCNADAGQTVFHIHLHLLGGKPMGWPPWP